jgi:flagellar hook-associated protein 3 FlgL
MKRISSQLSGMDSSYNMRLREWEMSRETNKVGTQSRIKDLRDDPLAAARSTRYQSEILRGERYAKNVDAVRGTLAVAEGNLMQAVDVLQRMRELAVQGATGTLNPAQLGYIGEEVDQLLGELVNVGNAKAEDGTYLFAGTRSRTEPFRTTQGHVPGTGGDRITQVDYLGDNGRRLAEISDGATVGMNMPGQTVFWAEQQQVYSTVDASSYRVQADSRIRIDGTEIDLRAGDNVYAIIGRLNEADVALKAELDPVSGSLTLRTTQPHQIWAEDLAGGTVLQDLGIIARDSPRPPLNFAPGARVFGGSVFDMAMSLRDALLEGSSEKVGGVGIRGIDDSIQSVSTALAEIGSKDARLEGTGKRISAESVEITAFDSEDRGLDLAESITRLRMLEYGHEAALAASARVLQKTLLDYLR